MTCTVDEAAFGVHVDEAREDEAVRGAGLDDVAVEPGPRNGVAQLAASLEDDGENDVVVEGAEGCPGEVVEVNDVGVHVV